MDFIYFNLDLSLVAYLKAFAFNKNIEREVCYVRSAKLFFSLFLKFPNKELVLSGELIHLIRFKEMAEIFKNSINSFSALWVDS